MAHKPSQASIDKLEEELFQRAVATWGKERADILRPALPELARNLATLRVNLPDREEQPAFFMSEQVPDATV